MPNCKSVYEPREDSSLLEKHTKSIAKGKVLDIGTGSGIQALAAALRPSVKSVLAVDIQKEVVNYCKENIKNRKIKFIQSDLFEKINEKFDTILFNPPYLPQELKELDITLEGGKKGYEVIERFLDQVNNYLSKDGIILMIFSSLTNKEKVEEFIKSNLLEFQQLDSQHIFFEDIILYKIQKSEFLKELETNKISNVKFFKKGKRGFIYTGTYKNKKIAIKTLNPKSTAIGRIEIEKEAIKKLKKTNIPPKLVLEGKNYFAYEFIEGELIIDYLKKSNKNQIKKILIKVLNQCHELDKLGFNKEEMQHPIKHIIIKNEPKMIDFERTRKTPNPKNVTQFCQFIASKNLTKILVEKNIKMKKAKIMELTKEYKKSKNNFNEIIKLIERS